MNRAARGVETYVVFGQLNFNGLGVRADRSLCVQGGVCVAQPGLELRQGMLELTQSQQGSLKLVLWCKTDRQRQTLRFKSRNSNIWTVKISSCQRNANQQRLTSDVSKETVEKQLEVSHK